MNKIMILLFIITILFLSGCITENNKNDDEEILEYVPERFVRLESPKENSTISGIFNITWSITTSEIPSKNARKLENKKDDFLSLYYSNDKGTNWNLIINWSLESNSTIISDGLYKYNWDTKILEDGKFYQIKIEAYLPNKSIDFSKGLTIKNN